MEEEICLILEKKELKVLQELVESFENLPGEQAIFKKLKKKIKQCSQNWIDEDSTNQKEFSKQKFIEPIYNELMTLFNKSKEPITISIDENIKYANFEFCKMLGYEAENEIIELGFFNLISKRCLPKIKKLRNLRLKGEIVPNIHNLEMKRADGSLISIECIHYCMPFDKSYFIISFYIGLTEIQSLEKKLRESEERYRILFENSPVGIGIADIEGRVFEANKAMRELSGYTAEELNSLGLAFIYIDPSERERLLKALDEYYKVCDYEVKLKRKDGTEYMALMNIDMIKLNDKDIILTSIRDISERKKAEQKLKESEKRFRNLFNKMSSGVAVYEAINDGEDFIFKDFNLAGEKIENIKKEDLIGKSFLKMFPGVKEFGLYVIFQKVWRTGIPAYHPISQYKDERITGWRENYIYKLPSGEIVAVYDDITRQKQAEFELKESEKKYRFAFNRENFYKDLFAHDIINIFNNILTATELFALLHLNDLEKKGKFESVKELIDLIKNQGVRGTKLIDNVRKLSQIEEENIPLKSMDMCEMLTKAIEFTKSYSLKKKVEIRVESVVKKVFVEANELLFDVFENILNNALKYNDNSQIEIVVRISKVQKEKINYIKIEFLDNGIGIPDERKESIFQRAYKEDIRVDGMGFGLSLVKKLIEIYNGEIWIEDRVKGKSEKGSNFIILIPVEV